MISIDDRSPPDHSSSAYQYNHQEIEVSHDLKINNGEKALAFVSDTDLLKPTDANFDDTNNPLPNFSIRDYVFGSRCKDIACNWPFSRESLQICLQYGVKNLLPPFQSLDLLRSNYPSGSRSALPNEETVSSFDGKLTGDRIVSLASCSIESQCHDLEEDLAYTKPNKSHPASSQTTQTTVKKLNSGVEPVEEVTANNLVVSETMASKTCPVCKAFSSSSNTTLNAHIDRCLSEVSSMKWAATPKITVKHRIKPRKTRLMVDIYETAPRCTVEELDRRNGTSWATSSNFHDQELEFQAEEKKEDSHEVADHEGAVYIDTNGTKVRILSMPTVGTLDDHEARKLQKGVNGGKIVTKKKKKRAYGKKSCQQFFELGHTNKKLCSLKPHHATSEVIGSQEEYVAIQESCNKEDEGEKPMKARVHKQMDDCAITRPPWACSKRTALTKKFNGKDGMLHSRCRAAKDLLVDSDKSSSGSGSKKARTWSRQLLTTSCMVKYLSSGSPVGNCENKRFPKPKERSCLRDSYEDPPGIRSKGGKFPSLNSASQERDAGFKFYQKRKFSALKKSRVHCFSTENVVMGPSQDSSKLKSRIEEGTSKKLSFEVVNVQEVKKKKSITSKSSNGDSLDDEFLESRLDNNFDSQERMELYQGRLCSPMRTLDDIENVMIEHTTKDSMDDYFQEVDPIPIPGPPGSFLPPSPGGDMVSEELEGNSSSTTTSRVRSGEDQNHHDMINQNSTSDSPISTVSSSSFTRSDDKLSVRFTSVNAGDLRSVDAIFTENPCCCSRKERELCKNVLSYHQESVVLQESNSSELFSPLNHPPPETVEWPADASATLPLYKDCESAVSHSTPVLRLMGKNLTVVKTDEDVSRCMGQHLHKIGNNHHNSFFCGYPSQYDPVIFNHDQNG